MRLPGVAHFAGADGDDFAFNGFLFSGIGNEDAAFGDLHLFDPFDQNPVIQGFNLHIQPP